MPSSPLPHDRSARVGAAQPTNASAVAAPPRPRLGRIENLLVEQGVVTYEALAAAKDRQRGAKLPLVEVLLEQEAVDEDRLVAVLAKALGITVSPAEALDPDPSVQDLVSAELAQRLGLLPLRVEGGTLIVATGDPLQLPAFDELAMRTGLRVQTLFAKPSDVRKAISRVRGPETALHDLLKNAGGDTIILETDEAAEAHKKRENSVEVTVSAEDAPTIRFVNLVISDAVRQGVSDIHVEAEKDALKVRFRVDGDLREVLSVPASLHATVSSRIKIIAGLDIMETRRPQDGRIKVKLEGKEYDLRVSTIPSYFGEKVVMRVLDPSAATFSLDRCGIDAAELTKWREMIHRPNGLVLMTGPTGSGKTSTLYASLLEIRDPSMNLVTVEDPVEYQFPGIVHVPVRSDIGMTFAAALRSILRQDPDVVLLGEIRDAETAQVALQAAMTGHLVLSTLHTNDAVGAIARLFDLGVDPQVVGSTLLGVMAQRLARTVCAACAEPHAFPAAELTALGWDAVASVAGTRKGRGCTVCHNTGLKGRTALVELCAVTPELSRLIARRAPPSEIAAQAALDGMRPLVDSGLRKVLAGRCTPGEIGVVAAKEIEAIVTAAPAPRVTPSVAVVAAPAVAAPLAPTPSTAGTCAQCGEVWLTVCKFCPSCGTPPAAAATGPTVLVCDDEFVARRVAMGALRADFPRIVEAKNGREALDLITASMPDLLVVDQDMPVMTGIELIRILRSQLETARIPILMLTASLDEALESVSLDTGADDYLQKPVQPQRLRARARALIAARKRWTKSV